MKNSSRSRRVSDEMAGKQSRFKQRVGGRTGWKYDLEDCSVTLGSERFCMTPIGTHSPEYQTWLWAWANEDFPEVARAASREIQSLHTVTGFRVFINPGIEASEEDADDFAALAVHQLGAIGFFREASSSPTLYVAVHEHVA